MQRACVCFYVSIYVSILRPNCSVFASIGSLGCTRGVLRSSQSLLCKLPVILYITHPWHEHHEHHAATHPHNIKLLSHATYAAATSRSSDAVHFADSNGQSDHHQPHSSCTCRTFARVSPSCRPHSASSRYKWVEMQHVHIKHRATVELLIVCTGWPLLRVRTSDGYQAHLVEPSRAEALQESNAAQLLHSSGKRARDEE